MFNSSLSKACRLSVGSAARTSLKPKCICKVSTAHQRQIAAVPRPLLRFCLALRESELELPDFVEAGGSLTEISGPR